MARKATGGTGTGKAKSGKPKTKSTAKERRKSSDRRRPPGPGEIRQSALNAALTLTAAEGWRTITLESIAAAAGLSLTQLKTVFPCKAAILNGFFERIDTEVLAGGPADADETPRDRLFEVLMRRFDALTPHREVVRSILHDCTVTPLAGLVTLPRFLQSMAWMMEAAGLSASGLRGLIHTKGLAAIYLYVLSIWLDDDSPDLAKTMAALDKGLTRADNLIAVCSRFCPPRSKTAADAATEDAP